MNLYYRPERKYKAHLAYLDDQVFLAAARGIAEGPDQENYEYDDISYTVVLELDREPVNAESRRMFEEAIYDAYAQGCECEYDCCAHYFGGPRQFRWVGRVVTFVVSLQPNI